MICKAALAAADTQRVRSRELCQQAIALRDRARSLHAEIGTLHQEAQGHLADLKRLDDEGEERLAAILAAEPG